MTTLKRLLPHAWRQSLKRKLFHHHDMGSRLENLRHAGFQPEILVDVGAFEGSWTRECKQVWPNAKVLMIEPLPHKRKKLERTADELSDVSMISCALSEQTGNVGFRSAETNSAIQIEVDVNSEMVVVPCRMLDDVLSERNLAADLIKIDVQGHELQVLRGGKQAISNAEVIILEVSLIQIGEVPLFREIDRFMESSAFRLYDIIPQYYRPLDGALWQADAFYVAERSALIASRNWD